jgi:hypothetical protein
MTFKNREVQKTLYLQQNYNVAQHLIYDTLRKTDLQNRKIPAVGIC